MRLDSKWASDGDLESSNDVTEDSIHKLHSRVIESKWANHNQDNVFKSPDRKANKSKLSTKWDDNEKTPREINFRTVNQHKEEESRYPNFGANSNRSKASCYSKSSNKYNKRNSEYHHKSTNNSLFERIEVNKNTDTISLNQADDQTNESTTSYDSNSDENGENSGERYKAKPLPELSSAAKSFAQRLGVDVSTESTADAQKQINSRRNRSPKKGGLMKPFQHDEDNHHRRSPRKSQRNNRRNDNKTVQEDSGSKIDRKAYEELLEQVNSLKFQNEQLEKIISDSKISLIPEPPSGSWADWEDE